MTGGKAATIGELVLNSLRKYKTEATASQVGTISQSRWVIYLSVNWLEISNKYQHEIN